MGWLAALAWADQLVFGGHDDWRLPSIGSPAFEDSFGMNIATGELGYMFYENLGNLSDPDHSGCSPNCATNSSFVGGTGGLTLSFENFQSDEFWYGEEFYAPGSDLDEQTFFAWVFGTHNGGQYPRDKGSGNDGVGLAWAVRDGDITVVPEPSALGLLGVGLFAVTLARRRRSI